MDVLKRTAAVACAPVAGVWSVTCIIVGGVCLFVSTTGATVYAAGNYIATGKCYNPNSMVIKILNTTEAIANAPLVLLYGPKPEGIVPVAPQLHTIDEINAKVPVVLQHKKYKVPGEQ
jgi:hypothetical protein